MINKNIVTTALIASLSLLAVAQDKKTDLGTEVVNVVKTYEATITDAYKVSELPPLDEQSNLGKKKVSYEINSFPVASTFVPEKGEAAKVTGLKNVKYFDNYALLSIGNYTNIIGEAFVSHRLNSHSYIAATVNHFSSNGGVKKVIIDDKFSKTKGALFYGGQKKNFGWKVEGGASYQLVNWYGLPLDEYSFDYDNVVHIENDQHYKDIYLNVDLNFKNSPLTGVQLVYDRFWDDYGMEENRFFAKPRLKTSIGFASDLNVDFLVDYAGTKYKNELNLDGGSKEYNNLTFGLSPSMIFAEEDYSVELGVGLYFNHGEFNRNTDNTFHVFPQVKASYNIAEGIAIAYAGIEGKLVQNTFKQFAEENYFLSPNLAMTPTKQKYDLYVGMKGKFDNNIFYNVKASYKNEGDKALFLKNTFSPLLPAKPYALGNSFGIEYAKLKTFNVFGELRYNLEEQIEVGLFGEINSYDTSSIEAWNLPKVKLGLDAGLKLSKEWYVNMSATYVGKRFDRLAYIEPKLSEELDASITERKNVKSYVDMNVQAGYRPNMNWTIFVRGNNLFNQRQQDWSDYRMQGIQFSVGAIYKFSI